jgi:hypothetical protein
MLRAASRKVGPTLNTTSSTTCGIDETSCVLIMLECGDYTPSAIGTRMRHHQLGDVIDKSSLESY